MVFQSARWGCTTQSDSFIRCLLVVTLSWKNLSSTVQPERAQEVLIRGLNKKMRNGWTWGLRPGRSSAKLQWRGCNEEQRSSNSPLWSVPLWSWRRSNWLLLRRSLEEISAALLSLSSPLTLWCLHTRGLQIHTAMWGPPLRMRLWDSAPQRASLSRPEMPLLTSV